LQIAGAAYKSSQLREPMIMDTLAAAQAELGKFDEALATQKQAIEKARALRNDALVAELEKHAEAYAKKQPFRDARLKPEQK
jgi:F0F1-type ATP synthase membrane subunit b/b'